MIKGFIKKFNEISEGWTNLVIKDPEIEAMAKERATECAKCPHAVPGKWIQSMPDKSIKEIEGLKCEICTCPLSAATRSPKKECPHPDGSKWLKQPRHT